MKRADDRHSELVRNGDERAGWRWDAAAEHEKKGTEAGICVCGERKSNIKCHLHRWNTQQQHIFVHLTYQIVYVFARLLALRNDTVIKWC